VDAFVRLLRPRGVNIYDAHIEHADRWGAGFHDYVEAIYAHPARYQVVFASESYRRAAWRQEEMRGALIRAFRESSQYVLPVRLDETKLPGLSPAMGYLDAREMSLSEITALIRSRLTAAEEDVVADQLTSDDEETRAQALNRVAVHRLSEHLDRAMELVLDDSSSTVRAKAAWALDRLNDVRALPVLIEAIHDPVWEVRSNAGWALVHLGETVRPEVERILRESDNPDAQIMADLVLRRL
jgi:hypothetical protein